MSENVKMVLCILTLLWLGGIPIAMNRGGNAGIEWILAPFIVLTVIGVFASILNDIIQSIANKRRRRH